MAELLKEIFAQVHELDVTMDDEDRHLSVAADGPDFHMFFCRTGEKFYDEEGEMIKLSIDEAKNLYYCIDRVVNWDEELESELSADG